MFPVLTRQWFQTVHARPGLHMLLSCVHAPSSGRRFLEDGWLCACNCAGTSDRIACLCCESQARPCPAFAMRPAVRPPARHAARHCPRHALLCSLLPAFGLPGRRYCQESAVSDANVSLCHVPASSVPLPHGLPLSLSPAHSPRAPNPFPFIPPHTQAAAREPFASCPAMPFLAERTAREPFASRTLCHETLPL